MDGDEDEAIPIDDLIKLPSGSVHVTDADDEVFLLYTRLASAAPQDGTKAFTGLGSVDSRSDVLSVPFTVPAKLAPVGLSVSSEESSPAGHRKRHGKAGRARRSGLAQSHQPTYETMEVLLAQDKTALRTRKGDTGSVLWRASVDFGQMILDQILGHTAAALMDPSQLSNCHVLELGAGTGLMGIILSRWVRQYTVTDLQALIPLIEKNLSLNEAHLKSSSLQASPDGCRNVTAEALDWFHLLETQPSTRLPIFRLQCSEPIDIILVIDCIYNPSLVPALIETIDYYSVQGKTRVLVVVELRAEDVIREFIECWLSKGWTVWRVGGELQEGWMYVRYAVWVGWKVSREDSEQGT